MTLREQIAAASAKATLARQLYDAGVFSARAKAEALGQYADLLMQADRAGQIIIVEDEQEAVDKLGFSIWHQLGQIEENARAGQLTQDEVRAIATAALAALKEPTP